MTRTLRDFPIHKRWPARHPDRLQLYSVPSPNGVKVSIMLEETGLPFEAHRIDFGSGEQRSEAFLSLNPNGKIPAIIDPDGPGDEPLTLFESGAILLYLADKTGQLVPADPAARWHAVQWVFFQVGHIGPSFGQVGYFHKFEGRTWEDKSALNLHVAESVRLLGIMDSHLADREWFVAESFSIADIAMLGMVRNLIGYYRAGELVGFERFGNVAAWLDRGLARPAVQRGLAIP